MTDKADLYHRTGAQQARAADRFAREILAFLKSFYTARSRRLTGKALGRAEQFIVQTVSNSRAYSFWQY